MSSGFTYLTNYGFFTWKAPVANASLLPIIGNTLGDARVATDLGFIHVWNGTSWINNGGAGTVTSVDLGVPTGFSSSGGPITGAGVLSFSTTLSAGQIPFSSSGGFGGFGNTDGTNIDIFGAGNGTITIGLNGLGNHFSINAPEMIFGTAGGQIYSSVFSSKSLDTNYQYFYGTDNAVNGNWSTPGAIMIGSSNAPTRTLSVDSTGNTYLSFNQSGTEEYVMGSEPGVRPWLLFDPNLSEYTMFADTSGNIFVSQELIGTTFLFQTQNKIPSIVSSSDAGVAFGTFGIGDAESYRMDFWDAFAQNGFSIHSRTAGDGSTYFSWLDSSQNIYIDYMVFSKNQLGSAFIAPIYDDSFVNFSIDPNQRILYGTSNQILNWAGPYPYFYVPIADTAEVISVDTNLRQLWNASGDPTYGLTIDYSGGYNGFSGICFNGMTPIFPVGISDNTGLTLDPSARNAYASNGSTVSFGWSLGAIGLSDYTSVIGTAEGLLAYDNTNHTPIYYDGTSWVDLGGGATSLWAFSSGSGSNTIVENNPDNFVSVGNAVGDGQSKLSVFQTNAQSPVYAQSWYGNSGDFHLSFPGAQPAFTSSTGPVLFDGVNLQFSSTNGIVDVAAGLLSIDPNSRTLLESDGTTVALDWSGTDLALPNATVSTGASIGTFTNAPASGNPTGYLTIKINGTNRKIPFW